MYFKITNSAENHNGFQYFDGLNVLKEKFNNDPNQSCCPGGLYFTDGENIFKFLNYGIYLREVTLPIENPDFKKIKDPEGDKWRANMIILEKRYALSDIDTFKYLVENGANIHAGNDCALKWSAIEGHLNVVQFLVEKGADIHADNDYALKCSAKEGARLINATLLHLLIAAAKKLKTFSSSFGCCSIFS